MADNRTADDFEDRVSSIARGFPAASNDAVSVYRAKEGVVSAPHRNAGAARRAVDGLDAAAYAVVAGVGALLWWLCAEHPAVLPSWAPWEFAPLQFASFWVIGWWFARGMAASPRAERPALWRVVCFAAGMVFTYAVLLTRFEYLAEHMFFLNRLQHIVMHHLGPLLIVLGWPGLMIKRGMPAPLRRMIEARWVVRPVHWIQQPILAAVLFVGLIYLWLIPPVHFRAMIDPDLYALMNWSMVVDGILFWSLILDPRPRPPARIGFPARAGLAIAVMFPQILVGAVITFSSQDLYDFYHWCGRIYPSVGAARDQMFGGLIVWIPGAMMSVVAMLVVLGFMFQAEKKDDEENEGFPSPAVDAGRWTGM